MSLHARHAGTSTQPADNTSSIIGRPVLFSEGPFAGRTIRAQLVELQKADLGAESGIDGLSILRPSPNTAAQREEEYVHLSEAECYGFICHIDLFPVPQPVLTGSPSRSRRLSNQFYQRPSASESAPTLNQDVSPILPRPNPDVYPRARTFPEPSASGQRWDSHRHAAGATTGATSGGSRVAEGVPGPVTTHMNGLPVPESSRCTTLIVGTTFSAASCIDYQGVRQLMFVFSDLAVKEDGDFFLRYRVFNTLYSVAGNHPIPVLAECFGGPFRVFSTKDFPGLRASTELTKHIAHFGVRINSREFERKRRKSSHAAERPTFHQRELLPSPQAGSSSRQTDDPEPHSAAYGNRRGRGSTF
ncbi:velvet factor-domain-containing protein [Fomitopsis serialis]|uniref:velvet factor-domain-containing protein n=1 Tax=Fomitopsis serialis TaxID=139415 RepID=UPI00200798B9|nr:velvet factor-domain-containing protein [Neoantrodia serialis]KAH9931951.1 velvet factor-domain-containing protein [Neoantrodia serialis]